VDNNGLTRQRTFGNRVTRRGDGCRGEKVKFTISDRLDSARIEDRAELDLTGICLKAEAQERFGCLSENV